MIYIVNGAPGAGKTTFETNVQKCMSNSFCYILSTVDFVKEIAKKCGWDGTKDLKNRKFLSDLKDLLTNWNNVPFNKIVQQVKSIEDEWKYYDIDLNRTAIFIDCREPEEIQKLCATLNAKSLLNFSDVVLAIYLTLFGVIAISICNTEKISPYWPSSMY